MQLTEINDEAGTEVVVRDDRTVKLQRADGTEIQSRGIVLGAFFRQGFRFISAFGHSERDDGLFFHAEAIYTGPRDSLPLALALVTAELGEECVFVNDPGTFKLRLPYEGEAALVEAELRERSRHEYSLIRLAQARRENDAYEIECELANVAEHKTGMEMWAEDLALLRSGATLAEVEDAAWTKIEGECVAA
jgi:hypothetical protein